MKTLWRLSQILLMAGGWALAASSLHLVRGPGNIPYVGKLLLVPKQQLSFRQIWVDLTTASPEQLADHHAILHRLRALGHEETVEQAIEMATQRASGAGAVSSGPRAVPARSMVAEPIQPAADMPAADPTEGNRRAATQPAAPAAHKPSIFDDFPAGR